LLLYSHTIGPRLKYITGFIGSELFGKPLQLTADKTTFRGHAGPKINYSNEQIAEGEFWLRPHALLFENDIRKQTIDCFFIEGHPVFFRTEGALSYDILAASFYLLSRYEEYLLHKKDMYDRYDHENSLAYQENFLNRPLVNIWLDDLKVKLKLAFPQLEIPGTRFRFIPTYDIDEAWSYKHKEWWRTAGGVGKAILKGEFSRLGERGKVLGNKMQDPFDSYNWIDKINQEHRLTPRYFFLVAEKTGMYDRNILPHQKALQNLIKDHSEKYDIGIHPSWQSGDDPVLLQREILALERITGKVISSSRQHFIRFTLPHTYRYLISSGIREDYSMGYGTINGFRASVASPFYWYDLEKEEQTSLVLYPFCFMEANSFFEQKISPPEALEEMKQYFQAIRQVNGMMITVWHNTFLGTDKLFKGWKEIYKKFVEEISS
jgi:hypothetical protein